jgi:glycosyltransferase involved in cell wall biosynthesis
LDIQIILHTNPWHYNTASANRLLSLIEGLASQGLELKLYIYGGCTSQEECTIREKKGFFKMVEYEYLYDEVIEGYWKIRWHNYIGKYFHKNKLINTLIQKLKQEPGIIWTDASHFGFELAYKLKKHFPKKIVFTEISEFLDIHQYNKGNFLQRYLGNQRQKFFERKAFYAYDGIALMTKTLVKHFESLPAPHPRFLHLPMTVDLDRFNNATESLPEFQKPYISFVGVMNDAKDGVNILIEAFHRIANKYPAHKLYLVGPWNYDTPLHLKLIQDYELTDRVFWMKEYPRDQIPQIISQADLLVLPRPDSKQAQGGFPTKLGEYLATGNPVCATRVGELPDYLEDNESVFFATPGSVDSFAEAMASALGDPIDAKRVGQNGKKIAKTHFNKDIQVKTLFDFFQNLINKDGS